jgi:hypothetical protein
MFGVIQAESGVVASEARSEASDAKGTTWAHSEGSVRMSSKCMNGSCLCT